jgi:hypothetical protein
VLVDGQWRRIDPTAVVAPSRIEMGMSRALGADEPVPLFARLDGGWLKGAQLAFDAMNHAWRRNLVGFDRQRQRELWRELTIDRFAGWQIAAIAGGLGLAWAGVVLALSGLARAKREREQALWLEACTRLSPRGPAAPAARRADRVRLARKPALAAVRDRVRGDRRVVRGAALRPAAGATRRARRADRDARARGRRAARAGAVAPPLP